MFLTKSSKSPFYQIVYEVDGKRTTRSTKTNDFEKAKQFMVEFEKTLRNPPTISSIISLDQFKIEYINYIGAANSQKYIKQIEYTFLKFLKYTGDLNLHQIRLRLVENFIMSIFPKSPYLAHLHYRILKAAFSKAVDWEYIEENPFKKIKFPRIPRSKPIFITQSEFDIIISQTNNQILRDIFTVAFYTGMRLGEILNMKWSWIDLPNKLITIRCSDKFTTKSKKERIIPMNEITFQTISCRYSIASQNNFVFSKIPLIKFNNDFVSKNFKKSVRAALLDDRIHFHTLRHSFASLLVQKGVSLYIVKELLGHGDLATTQIYSHLQTGNLKHAINLL